jgi:hypothetical protein
VNFTWISKIRVGVKDLPEVFGVDYDYTLLALLTVKIPCPFQVFVVIAKRRYHKAPCMWINIPYPRP